MDASVTATASPASCTPVHERLRVQPGTAGTSVVAAGTTNRWFVLLGATPVGTSPALAGAGPYRVGGGRIKSRPTVSPDAVHGLRALTVAIGMPKYLAMLNRLSPDRIRYSQQSSLPGQAVSSA